MKAALSLTLAGAAALALALAVNPLAGEGGVVAAAAQEPPAAAAPPAPFALPPAETFRATLERPLFVRGRRGAVSARTAAASAPRLTVAGIAVGPRGRVALIQLDGAKESAPLTEGAVLTGWTVAAIRPGRVTLARGGEAFEAEVRDFQKIRK